MSLVRVDRFLVSTAVALLLSVAAGAASAEPVTGLETKAAPPTASDLDKMQPAAAPAAAIPAPAADQAVAPAATPAPAQAAAPAETPAPAQAAVPAETPAPAQAAVPAETPAPAQAAVPAETPAPAQAAVPTPAPAQAAVPAVTPTPDQAAVPAATPPADAQATAPTPAGLNAADAAIAEKLRELATGKFDRLVGGKKERSMIDAFYSGRDYAPLWLTDGQVNARANAVIAFLGGVDADGLDPADYAVPNFKASTDPAVLAEDEIQFTNSVLTFARHAHMGRVHWSRVSADISYTQTAPEPADVLADVMGANDVAAALGAYYPQQPGYKALKAKLAEIRSHHGETVSVRIAGGPVLKVGMQDARVPQLRSRLGIAGDGNGYDKALAEAVKKYQHDHKISASGTLTAATLDALNGRTPDKAADIIVANLERWRWMPHNLGKTYVMVNIPDFRLHVMSNGHEVWTTRIVTGKPGMPTPIMSAEMKYITVNPTWNVPPSIVNNEYLPALQQDPTVLTRMGLRVTHNPDGTVHISQPPGDGNALGRLRFNFPNKFLVYQHDTPDKNLFARDVRDFSHGCMRVQDPLKYAEVLLSLVRPGEGYTQERLHRMYGPNEADIQFPTFVPVHLTYQTAFVDDAGNLQFRDDIYGRDTKLLSILKGEERKVADIPVERKENAVRRQVLAVPEQAFWGNRSAGWNGQNNGDNFFSRLFGLAPQPAPPTPRKPVAHRNKTVER